MSDLIAGADLPLKKSKYMKFKQGDNTFRILSRGISGYIYWTEEDGKRKPNRVKTEEEAKEGMDNAGVDRNEAKYFITFKVWNYEDKAIEILEVTQRTIQESIINYSKNAKWGDVKKYDIVVTKTGEKMETKYQVTPNPKEELPAEIKKQDMEVYVNLNVLYENGDPFEKGADADETVDPTALPF